MKTRLDRGSAVPLYHQIAERIRYRIATARLRPGDQLPPVREAAGIWGVNLHTVRRAYQELAAAGLLEIRPPHAARVVAPSRAAGASGRKLERFLDGVVERAAREHALTPGALANLLVERSADGPRASGPVHVVECSELQASGHAREIEATWDVRALPWSLARTGEPPPGPLVATYFHYNDVRVRWPRRAPDVHFAGIRPDPAILDRLPRPSRGRRLALSLCELDRPLAEAVAADLAQILPPERYRVVPEVVRDPGARLTGRGRTPLLFPPRVWKDLSETDRDHERAVAVTYVFEPDELEALGRRFGWRRRRS